MCIPRRGPPFPAPLLGCPFLNCGPVVAPNATWATARAERCRESFMSWDRQSTRSQESTEAHALSYHERHSKTRVLGGPFIHSSPTYTGPYSEPPRARRPRCRPCCLRGVICSAHHRPIAPMRRVLLNRAASPSCNSNMGSRSILPAPGVLCRHRGVWCHGSRQGMEREGDARFPENPSNVRDHDILWLTGDRPEQRSFD